MTLHARDASSNNAAGAERERVHQHTRRLARPKRSGVEPVFINTGGLWRTAKPDKRSLIASISNGYTGGVSPNNAADAPGKLVPQAHAEQSEEAKPHSQYFKQLRWRR